MTGKKYHNAAYVFSIFFNSQNLTITRLPVNKFG